jgi:hypothetical protein
MGSKKTSVSYCQIFPAATLPQKPKIETEKSARKSGAQLTSKIAFPLKKYLKKI